MKIFIRDSKGNQEMIEIDENDYIRNIKEKLSLLIKIDFIMKKFFKTIKSL